jgi:2'-5' RNA ligase
MRLFAALLPPAGAVAQLADAVDGLRGLPGADRLRWTPAGGWHYTMAFYGEVDAAQRDDLCARLARAAARGGPLALAVAGAGCFGDRALWAGAEGDRDALAALARSCAEAGSRAGLTREDPHAFRAHLTLARSRSRHDAPGATDLRPFVAALAPFRGSTWTAGRLTLVRSVPPEPGVPGAGPRYVPFAAWPLGGPSGG